MDPLVLDFVYCPANFPNAQLQPERGHIIQFESRASDTLPIGHDNGIALIQDGLFSGWIRAHHKHLIWNEKSTGLESRLGHVIRFFAYGEENNDYLLKREDTEADENRKVLVDVIKQESIESRGERQNSVAREQEAEDSGSGGRKNISISEEQCQQKVEVAENNTLDIEEAEGNKVKAEVKDVACIIKEEVEDIKDIPEVTIQGAGNNGNGSEGAAEETEARDIIFNQEAVEDGDEDRINFTMGRRLDNEWDSEEESNGEGDTELDHEEKEASVERAPEESPKKRRRILAEQLEKFDI